MISEMKPSSSSEVTVAVAADANDGSAIGNVVDSASSAVTTLSPPPLDRCDETTGTTANTSNNPGDNDDDDVGDDMLLVTEFPPPPYYYSLASSSSQGRELLLTPPEIPYRAFRVAAKKARIEHQKRKRMEEDERRRVLQLSPSNSKDGGGDDGEFDGVVASKQGNIISNDKRKDGDNDDSSIDVDDPNEPLVAVFGEIVEDPTLFQGHDDNNGSMCDDPAIVRENVKQLNRNVLRGFLALVRKLAEDDPSDHRKLRDELSHNLFLMLQECNKFREHQAREILIDTLELQLRRRKMGLEVLRERIKFADDALDGLQKFREDEDKETDD